MLGKGRPILPEPPCRLQIRRHKITKAWRLPSGRACKERPQNKALRIAAKAAKRARPTAPQGTGANQKQRPSRQERALLKISASSGRKKMRRTVLPPQGRSSRPIKPDSLPIARRSNGNRQSGSSPGSSSSLLRTFPGFPSGILRIRSLLQWRDRAGSIGFPIKSCDT